MLLPDKVAEVRRLLAEGKSYREIAAATGVSRGSVGGIATGARRDRLPMRMRDHHYDEPLGPIGRCPDCGGRVHLPCRLCRTRAFVRGLRRTPRQVA